MSIILISGPGLQLSFQHNHKRLSLLQICRKSSKAILYSNSECTEQGAGPIGNPLTVVIVKGEHAGIYGIETFAVEQISTGDSRLYVELKHDTLPMAFIMDIEVEGNVSTWRGQMCWSGSEAVDIDIYYPIFSRVSFQGPFGDRALVPQISGTVLNNLAQTSFRRSYIGNLSSPVFILDGKTHGLAIVDDNRAEYAADVCSCAQRSQVISAVFPVEPNTVALGDIDKSKEISGPCVGICYRRFFHASDPSIFGAQSEPSQKRHYGEYLDIGPVRMYLYEGSWKTGAAWLRDQRKHVSFRTSNQKWYEQTTFLAEDMGDDMLKRNQSFYDYPKILSCKEALGASLFHIPGFHDPEVLGSTQNWLNRGDYFYAAQNLGGFEAAARGIEAIHRRGGRILYYVEGLIVWKRSRIGRTLAKEWALMNESGGYDFIYKGFWHMCPACKEWCEWLGQTCAEIMRTTGVDGFFVDSSCATSNHRCFNPAHRHPHPDVWAWGLRQMFRVLREHLDKVNPGAIILSEGVADMAREYIDGFVSHTHDWTQMNFGEPLVRFLHPQMRAFESWAHRGLSKAGRTIEWLHVWNSVSGQRIYSHTPDCESMAHLSIRTRRYYDMYPEICDSNMSVHDIETNNCYAQLFDGPPHVMTVGNLSAEKVNAKLKIPLQCGIIFDRVDSLRLAVENGNVELALGPWEFRAFELRP